jgi:hypothetical protein
MAEVLEEFSEPISGGNGIVYRAQVTGAEMADGLWEGWIEFIPVAGGTPLRTPRETTQPNRRNAVYWATGLTPVYLEGALERALKPLVQHVVPPPEPIFDGPAPTILREVEVRGPVTDAILDPFEVYENGEVMLRRKLSALEAWHLVNIIVAYNLSDEPVSTLQELSASALIELIVIAVRDDSGRGAAPRPAR